MRAMRWKPADIAIVVFVDIFRTLTQLVVIVFIYFGLPYADIQLSPFAATVLALGAVLAAFATGSRRPKSRFRAATRGSLSSLPAGYHSR